MKSIFLQIITYFRFLFNSQVKNINSLIWSSIICINGGKVVLDKCRLNRCSITSLGKGNEIIVKGWLYKSSIKVDGLGNSVIIGKGCELFRTRIVVRGDNCTVNIGDKSTAGSAFVVCMGKENFIQIGEDCMLSEDIDIWSTDSHSIYDEKGILINPSKPISIGCHVWLGKGTKVLKGVTIGDNAITGMNTVVTKNINSSSLNVGNPLRCIRNNINWKRDFIET